MTKRFMKRSREPGRVSLNGALLALVIVVLLAGFVPLGAVLESRLTDSLARAARADLAAARDVVLDREEQRTDVLMMHARDLAKSPGLSRALADGALEEARLRLRAAADAIPEAPVLVVENDRVLEGPQAFSALVEQTRAGQMPVSIMGTAAGLQRVALAPVTDGGRWVGAAGVTAALDRSEAGLLAGLTRSYVVFLGADGTAGMSSADPETTAAILRERTDPVDPSRPQYATIDVPVGETATALLARDLTQETAVLAQLRRVGLAVGAVALLGALLLGGVVAHRLARPVGALAMAADRLADGDFSHPVTPAGVREVRQVGVAFVDMRSALRGRMADLEAANRALGERQRRLNALQAELVHRERLAATGRLVTELAHEIRNPVANVRNCLELVRRRVADDPEARRFFDLAVDELLRMHRLAEHVLELNRPHSAGAHCDPEEVAAQVVALAKAGGGGAELEMSVSGSAPPVTLEPDALKQVLLSLVQNAMEASAPARVQITIGSEDERAVIDVLDDGPGIAEHVLDRVFDPFVTTKGAARGVGLGLFVADGIVRGVGGTIEATNREDRSGARFRLELPIAVETTVEVVS